MEALFVKAVNMSVNAGWLILAVILLRLILKKKPAWLICLMWGLVAVRLVSPALPRSSFSLIPTKEVLSSDIVKSAVPQIQSGIAAVDGIVNPVLAESMTANPSYSVNPSQIWSFVLAWVWIIGMCLMLLYALISFLILRRKLAEATLADAAITETVSAAIMVKQSERIPSPFVLGLFRPVIYLPYCVSPEDSIYVLSHEKAHIARGDHWWKLLGYLLLAVYWFQPLVWAAYLLFGKDLEAACDERVVRALTEEERKAYARALLHCSMRKKRTAPCPLAFGESDVKERIHNVVQYHRPALWALVLSVIICAAAAIGLLTDPKEALLPEALQLLELNGYTVAVVPKEREAGEPYQPTEDALELCVYKEGQKWALRSFSYDSTKTSAADLAAAITLAPFSELLGYDGFRVCYYYAPGQTGETVFGETDYYTMQEEPVHLAQSWGDGDSALVRDFAVDLNADGCRELICNVRWADGAEDAVIYQSDGERIYRSFGTDVMAAEEGEIPNYGPSSVGSRYLPENSHILGWFWDEQAGKTVQREYDIRPEQLPMWEFE